jgi:ribosomal protein S18 acetylase RimI-like enzyme
MLQDFQEKDFDNLYNFMRPLWLETYGSILPTQQIEFLLEKYFAPANIPSFRAQGYKYKQIGDCGVLVFIERETELYIDKLYLLPSARGTGIAAQVFTELLKLGKDLVLNVNQGNKRAVRCYLKNGFEIEQKIDIDLGNGMTNCDYVMRKKANR